MDTLPRNQPSDEPQPFDLWFGQTLRNLFEPVIHEALPEQMLRRLPPERGGGRS